MAKKTLKNESPVGETDWAAETIIFKYRDRTYRTKIEGNLVMRDMSLAEIKEKLNVLPGKFSYWKALSVSVEREIEDAEEDYALWSAEKYQEIVGEGKKLTETAIKNRIMLDNSKEYRVKMLNLKDLKDINKRIGVLVKGYDMQSWTLRSIANLTAQELGNIEVHGRGNLKDI